jgi:hypothetical protein
MKWIEKNSEIKARLPEIPHVDLEMQEEYYRRKAILESYEENLNKSEIEVDDMLGMEFETVPSSGSAKTDL